LPEFLAFQPALHGREPIPLGPFVANQLLRLNHGKQITESNRGGKLSFIPQRTPRELFGVEGLQVVRLFAKADEFDGQAELLLMFPIGHYVKSAWVGD